MADRNYIHFYDIIVVPTTMLPTTHHSKCGYYFCCFALPVAL